MAGAAGILTGQFRARYPDAPAPHVYRAPGRVNLIGEHTDYNLGFVMPIALDMACRAAWSPASDGILRVYSGNLRDGRDWPVAELANLPKSGNWSDYVLGVACELIRIGVPVGAGHLLVHSDVPVGSGLSSSAALEVSTALALLDGRSLSPMDLVGACHRAESQFVGMPCGVMDQYISVFGRENAALEIDCRTLQHQPVKLPAGVSIVAVNSMVKHELGASAYRERVAECSSALAVLQQRDPLVKSLRDAGEHHLAELEQRLAGPPHRRARHVITENERVQKFVKACEAVDPETMGQLFIASHRSLQHDYEVSCVELDFLVDTAIAIPGVFGARMTGGGFGGCTVNLVGAEAVAQFMKQIASSYKKQFGIDPQIYTCRPAAGAGRA